MRNPAITPRTPARAAGTLRQAEASATNQHDEEQILSADALLQEQLARALSGETGHRQSYLDSIDYYKKQIADLQGQIETGIPDDAMATEWQTTIDNLQKRIDASAGPAGSLRSEQRQWQRQLEARRQNLRKPIEDQIARYQRFLKMAESAYDREYDEHGMRRDTSFSKSFLRGLTNPRGLADSFAEGLMDTLIGLPILAASSPKLLQELVAYQEFIFDESRKRSEQAEVDAVIAAYGEGSPQHIQIQQNQLNTRMAWMRENAPNLVPIFEYYNESLVSAFQDPETFAKTLEERPFDVYVHALDVIPGLSHIIGGALQRGRMARRTASGRLHPSARAPSATERIVRGAGQVAQYANPEELPFEVGRQLLGQRGERQELVSRDPNNARRPTAGFVPETPEQPTIDLRRRGADPDAPEWERIDDGIAPYEGAPDPNRNPFILADTPDLDMPDWESPPMSTGGDPARGDQVGADMDNYQTAADQLRAVDDGTNEMLTRQVERFDAILAGEVEPTPFDPINALRIQLNQLDANNLDTMGERSALREQIGDRLLALYDSNEIPLENWEYLSLTEVGHFLEQAGRTQDAEIVEAARNQQWNQRRTEGADRIREERIAYLDETFAEAQRTGENLLQNANFFEELTAEFLETIYDLNPDYDHENLELLHLPDTVDAFEIISEDMSEVGMREALQMSAIDFVERYPPEEVDRMAEDERLQDEEMFGDEGELSYPEPVDLEAEREAIQEGGGVRTTGRDTAPEGFERTGETITADDLDDLFDRINRVMADEPETETRTDDDDDWEEPPMTTGGDPAEGDQLGEGANLRREVDETRNAAIDAAAEVLAAIRDNAAYLSLIRNVQRLDAPTLHEMVSILNDLTHQNAVSATRHVTGLSSTELEQLRRHTNVLTAEQINDLQPFLVAMNRHVLAIEALREYEQLESGSYSTTNPFRGGNLSVESFAGDRRGTTRIGERLNRANQEAAVQMRQRGDIRVPLDDTGERELIVTGATGVSPETIRNALDVFEITDLMLTDETGFAQVEFETFMNELNEILIPPEGATTTMNQRLDALEAIENERGSNQSQEALPMRETDSVETFASEAGTLAFNLPRPLMTNLHTTLLRTGLLGAGSPAIFMAADVDPNSPLTYDDLQRLFDAAEARLEELIETNSEAGNNDMVDIRQNQLDETRSYREQFEQRYQEHQQQTPETPAQPENEADRINRQEAEIAEATGADTAFGETRVLNFGGEPSRRGGRLPIDIRMYVGDDLRPPEGIPLHPGSPGIYAQYVLGLEPDTHDIQSWQNVVEILDQRNDEVNIREARMVRELMESRTEDMGVLDYTLDQLIQYFEGDIDRNNSVENGQARSELQRRVDTLTLDETNRQRAENALSRANEITGQTQQTPAASSVVSVEQLRDQIANRESSLEELANQIEEIGDEDAIYQREVEHLENELYEAEQALQELEDRDAYGYEIDDAQAHVDSLRGQLEEGDIDISIETQELQDLRDELESAIDRLEDDAETALYGYQEAGGFEQDTSYFVDQYGEALTDMYIDGNRSEGESAIDRLDLNDWLEAIEPEVEAEPFPEDGIWGVMSPTERGHWSNILRLLEEIGIDDIGNRSLGDIRTSDVTLDLLRDIDDQISAYLNYLDAGEVEANPFAGTDETSVTLVQNQLYAIIDRLEEQFALADGTRVPIEEQPSDTQRSQGINTEEANALAEDAWEQIDSLYGGSGSRYATNTLEDFLEADQNRGQTPTDLLGETYAEIHDRLTDDIENMRAVGEFWSPGEEHVRLLATMEDIRVTLGSQNIEANDYNTRTRAMVNPAREHLADVIWYLDRELDVRIEGNADLSLQDHYRVVRERIHTILEGDPSVLLQDDDYQVLEDVVSVLYEIEFYGLRAPREGYGRTQQGSPPTTPSTGTPTTHEERIQAALDAIDPDLLAAARTMTGEYGNDWNARTVLTEIAAVAGFLNDPNVPPIEVENLTRSNLEDLSRAITNVLQGQTNANVTDQIRSFIQEQQRQIDILLERLDDQSPSGEADSVTINNDTYRNSASFAEAEFGIDFADAQTEFRTWQSVIDRLRADGRHNVAQAIENQRSDEMTVWEVENIDMSTIGRVIRHLGTIRPDITNQTGALTLDRVQEWETVLWEQMTEEGAVPTDAERQTYDDLVRIIDAFRAEMAQRDPDSEHAREYRRQQQIVENIQDTFRGESDTMRQASTISVASRQNYDGALNLRGHDFESPRAFAEFIMSSSPISIDNYMLSGISTWSDAIQFFRDMQSMGLNQNIITDIENALSEQVTDAQLQEIAENDPIRGFSENITVRGESYSPNEYVTQVLGMNDPRALMSWQHVIAFLQDTGDNAEARTVRSAITDAMRPQAEIDAENQRIQTRNEINAEVDMRTAGALANAPEPNRTAIEGIVDGLIDRMRNQRVVDINRVDEYFADVLTGEYAIEDQRTWQAIVNTIHDRLENEIRANATHQRNVLNSMLEDFRDRRPRVLRRRLTEQISEDRERSRLTDAGINAEVLEAVQASNQNTNILRRIGVVREDLGMPALQTEQLTIENLRETAAAIEQFIDIFEYIGHIQEITLDTNGESWLADPLHSLGEADREYVAEYLEDDGYDRQSVEEFLMSPGVRDESGISLNNIYDILPNINDILNNVSTDWEEPPGSLGGDPSRGDQAGEPDEFPQLSGADRQVAIFEEYDNINEVSHNYLHGMFREITGEYLSGHPNQEEIESDFWSSMADALDDERTAENTVENWADTLEAPISDTLRDFDIEWNPWREEESVDFEGREELLREIHGHGRRYFHYSLQEAEERREIANQAEQERRREPEIPDITPNQQIPETPTEAFDQDRTRLEEMRDRRGTRNPTYRELALAYDVLTHEAARVAPEHSETLRSVEKHPEIEDIIEDVWGRTGDIRLTVSAITEYLDDNALGGSVAIGAVATQGAIRGETPRGFDTWQRDEDFDTPAAAFQHGESLRSHAEISYIPLMEWTREELQRELDYLDDDSFASERSGRDPAFLEQRRSEIEAELNRRASTPGRQPLPDNSMADRASDIRAMYFEHTSASTEFDDTAYENTRDMLTEFVGDYFNEAYLRYTNNPYADEDQDSDVDDRTPRDRFIDLFMDEVDFNRLEESSLSEFHERLEELVRDTFEEFGLSPTMTSTSSVDPNLLTEEIPEHWHPQLRARVERIRDVIQHMIDNRDTPVEELQDMLVYSDPDAIGSYLHTMSQEFGETIQNLDPEMRQRVRAFRDYLEDEMVRLNRDRLDQVVEDRIASRRYPFSPEVDLNIRLTQVDEIANTVFNHVIDDIDISNDELIEVTGIDPINHLEHIANSLTQRLEEDERHFTEEQIERIEDFIEHVRGLRDEAMLTPSMMPMNGYSQANPFV